MAFFFSTFLSQLLFNSDKQKHKHINTLSCKCVYMWLTHSVHGVLNMQFKKGPCIIQNKRLFWSLIAPEVAYLHIQQLQSNIINNLECLRRLMNGNPIFTLFYLRFWSPPPSWGKYLAWWIINELKLTINGHGRSCCFQIVFRWVFKVRG